MLNVLMFHQVYNAAKPDQVNDFIQYVESLSKTHDIVAPGDDLKAASAAVCLTFDDAYYDFYRFAFPLLKRLNIPAVLAVPTKYIVESTQLSDDVRLGFSNGEEMDGDFYKTKVPFCTWAELREMVDSGLVKIASHGLNHDALTSTGVDFVAELNNSKVILEEKLGCSIDTFVYPYGKFSKSINRESNKIYQYSMRIGSALNRSWKNSCGIIYRVNADLFWKTKKEWTIFDSIKYYYKYLSNVVRGK